MAIFFLLLVAPVILLVIEITVAAQVSAQIGLVETLALMLVGAVVGSRVAGRGSRAAVSQVAEAISQRKLPSKVLLDQALLVFAGVMIAFPGFVSDLIGLPLLIPFVRRLLIPVLIAIATKFVVRNPAVAASIVVVRKQNQRRTRSSPPGTRKSQPRDVDGTATEIAPADAPQLPKPQ